LFRPTLTLPAFAKINWTLRVIGKRADGYHQIDTVFQTISLHDTLKLSPMEENGIVLSCDDRSLPSDKRNLVWRAAAMLQARCAIKKGVRIHLEKRIPTQAGLGGGSADAVAALIGLAHLWNTDTRAEEFFEIASALGADMPFFLWGGTARGTGTGKDVTPLSEVPEKFLLVIKPNANVSTSRAYELLKARALTTSEAKIILSSSQADRFSENFGTDALGNDFEPVIFQLEPEIERARAALKKAGARAALLAGSGSAVFGIFDNQAAQQRAIQAIELESGWRVFPCNTVGRNHFRSAMGPCGAIFEHFTGH
jgi:4-diphosphocytidyl-2-C-methyl-D-erythritol kinase